ncbi:MAG: sulfatase, partial [Planctomycetota bacterium]
GVPDDGVRASWIFPLIEQKITTPRQNSCEGKNILVIVVDALRADHISGYGYPRDTTPELDRIAAQSVVFDHAYAQSSWTVPSTATIFTGQYAYTHGVYNLSHWFLLPGVETLAGAFRRDGLTTTCFSSNPLVCRGNNLSCGFELFHAIPYASAAQLNRAFLDWLDTRENERFFAYLHYMEPHGPYAAPGPAINRFMAGNEGMDLDMDKAFELRQVMVDILNKIHAREGEGRDLTADEKAVLQQLVDLYDGEIAYWDERFALLLNELDARGILENTLIVITSDHGEEFGDHGLLEHGQSLYNELLHVPLIFYNTGAFPQRRKDRVGLIDVAPTLLSMAEIPPPSTWKGKTRSPAYPGFDLFADLPEREFLFADTCHGSDQIEGDLFVMQAVFSDKLKAVLSMDRNSLELFDTIRDRAEQHPLDLSSNPLIETQMRKRVADWVQKCLESAPYRISLHDADALEKLREIGYVK